MLRDGSVEPDPSGTAPGRGAYLHREPACAQEAIRRRGFDRSYRAEVQPPDDSLLESLR